MAGILCRCGELRTAVVQDLPARVPGRHLTVLEQPGQVTDARYARFDRRVGRAEHCLHLTAQVELTALFRVAGRRRESEPEPRVGAASREPGGGRPRWRVSRRMSAV